MNKIYQSLNLYGFKITLKLIFLNIFFSDYLNFRRKIISKKLRKEFNSTIKYGPFEGVVLTNNSYWAEEDIGSILVGFYEKEVTDFIISSSKQNRNTFIDIGAADGYFAVSLLKKNFFNKSICYEQSSKGVESIKKNIHINNIENSKIEIRGKAESSFYKDFNSDLLSKSVILIDIEGGEYEILTDECLKSLKQSILVLELHPFFVENGIEKQKLLLERATKIFDVKLITTLSRNPNEIVEFDNLHDNDKWLICSEGRSNTTQWLTLIPKKIEVLIYECINNRSCWIYRISCRKITK